jgi:hypothetical protein
MKMRKYKKFGLGIGLLILGFFANTLYTSPTAQAASPGCPDGATPGTGCVTLVVKLNPAPKTNATVTAKRQASHGADDSLTLVATSPDTYKSAHAISFSSVEACSNGATSPQNKYNISVSGSATGTLSGINICNNENPKADNNDVKTVTVKVTTANNPSPNGGISGNLTITKPNGSTASCGAGAALDVSGPTDKTNAASTDSNGHFNTGLILKPGKYQIVAECPTDGDPFHYKLTGIDVQAGKITDIGKANSTGGSSTSDPTGAKDACKDYGPNGTKPNHSQALNEACIAGFEGAVSGKSQDETCKDYRGDSLEACKAGFSAGNTNNDDDTSACVTNGGTGAEWLFCPLTLALGKSADKMNAFIENQLRFSTNQFLPDSGSNAGVYKAWTIIKNLASSILIIVLLIMVFAQAIGNGLFEAYTIRKILPRLVFAVIAMQLSWELCIFFINVANHLGDGLAQLITAPFGGVGNLDLDSILNHLSNFWAGAANVGLGAALVAAGFIAISNPAGAILVAFTVILSVVVALATILFRNIIIIACVMLAPLALILWVIPSSAMKKYWNLWSDNFTRALLLFPVMVGIIYTGRIFAWIVGGLDGPGFIDFIMVLVGFFGPYYMLPQSFKWGGSIMSQGYGAISKGGNALGKKPKEYLSARKEEYAKERKRQSQERVSEGHPSFIKGDHFRSGKWDPLYGVGGRTGSRLREARLAAYEAGGASSFEEENKQFEQAIEAREKGLNERARKQWVKKGGGVTEIYDEAEKDKEGNTKLVMSGDKDDLVQAISKKDNSIKFRMVDGNELTIDQMFGEVKDEHVEAALGRMASLGGNPNLTALNSEVTGMMGKIDEAERKGTANSPEIQEMNRRLNRFLGRSAGTMFGKMPHWYKGAAGAAEGLSPDQLAGVSGAAMESMITTLEKDAKSSNEKTRKDASGALAGLARTWGEAVDNPNTFGRIDAKSREHMGKFLARIDPLKDSIAMSSKDVNVQNDTRAVLTKLQHSITPQGTLRTQASASQTTEQQGAPAAGGTTTQPEGTPPTPTGAAGQQGSPAGQPQGSGAPGTGGTGNVYTPPQQTQAFDYERNAQAIARALDESGALKIPHGNAPQAQAPGQVILPTAGKTESGLDLPSKETIAKINQTRRD